MMIDERMINEHYYYYTAAGCYYYCWSKTCLAAAVIETCIYDQIWIRCFRVAVVLFELTFPNTFVTEFLVLVRCPARLGFWRWWCLTPRSDFGVSPADTLCDGSGDVSTRPVNRRLY